MLYVLQINNNPTLIYKNHHLNRPKHNSLSPFHTSNPHKVSHSPLHGCWVLNLALSRPLSLSLSYSQPAHSHSLTPLLMQLVNLARPKIQPSLSLALSLARSLSLSLSLWSGPIEAVVARSGISGGVPMGLGCSCWTLLDPKSIPLSLARSLSHLIWQRRWWREATWVVVRQWAYSVAEPGPTQNPSLSLALSLSPI